MKMSKQEYGEYVKKKSPHSSHGKNLALAFVIGGLICSFGQALTVFYTWFGLDKDTTSIATSITLVFFGAFFTGLGLYDRLAKHAGAGTLVPITGFANSVAAPALEFKTEGMITGMAAKMFIIAGPVIVFGVSASVVYGIVLVLLQRL